MAHVGLGKAVYSLPGPTSVFIVFAFIVELLKQYAWLLTIQFSHMLCRLISMV